MLVVYYLQMHPLSSGHTDIHSELVQEVKDGLGCWMFPFSTGALVIRWDSGMIPFRSENSPPPLRPLTTPALPLSTPTPPPHDPLPHRPTPPPCPPSPTPATPPPPHRPAHP